MVDGELPLFTHFDATRLSPGERQVRPGTERRAPKVLRGVGQPLSGEFGLDQP